MWPRLWQRFCWADSYPRELKCKDGGERFVPGKWTIPDSLVVWQRLENTACCNNVTRVNRHFFAICHALASFFIEGKDCKGKSSLQRGWWEVNWAQFYGAVGNWERVWVLKPVQFLIFSPFLPPYHPNPPSVHSLESNLSFSGAWWDTLHLWRYG